MTLDVGIWPCGVEANVMSEANDFGDLPVSVMASRR
jgi:hypothetical protein